MVVRMRSTRSHTGNRRSHHALKAVGFRLCEKCGNPKSKHAVCAVCGTYKGRDVLNTIQKAEKKLKKKKAETSDK